MNFRKHDDFEEIVREALAAYREALKSAIEKESNPIEVQVLQKKLQDIKDVKIVLNTLEVSVAELLPNK